MNKIEILLATYNGEKFLPDQLESIIKQTYKEWKLLIHDDGSTDNTISILEKYANKYPDKIFLIEDNAKGLGPCFNFEHLLNHSTAQYVLFCDQDDFWLPHKIEYSYNSIRVAEQIFPDIPIVFFTDKILTDENLNVIETSVWDIHSVSPSHCNYIDKMLVKSIIGGNTMILNENARRICLPFPKEAIMHDWWVSLMVTIKGKCFYSSLPSLYYRQHSKNVIGVNKTKKLTNIIFSFKAEQKLYKKLYLMANKAGQKLSLMKYIKTRIKIQLEKNTK